MDYASCWHQHQDFCKEIVQQINLIRRNPRSFVPYLNIYIESFEDNCLFIPDAEFGIELEDGLDNVSSFLGINEIL
jgi:hypothetical protein